MESAGIITGFLPEYLVTFVDELDEHPWLFASLASLLVGLSGILPLLIIPVDKTASFKDGPGAATLRVLLSFAVGGLLGDVFLHLLPEAWQHDLASTKEGEHVSMKCGLWCLFGMLVFIIVEKLFATSEGDGEEDNESPKLNGSVRQIEIEEIDKLLEAERKNRGKKGGEGICGGNGTITAKQLYDSCVFNNNIEGGALLGRPLDGPLPAARGPRQGRRQRRGEAGEERRGGLPEPDGELDRQLHARAGGGRVLPRRLPRRPAHHLRHPRPRNSSRGGRFRDPAEEWVLAVGGRQGSTGDGISWSHRRFDSCHFQRSEERYRGEDILDRPVHGGRVPAHRAGDRAARPAARAGPARVAQAPGRAAGRHRRHGRHDQLLRLSRQVSCITSPSRSQII